MPSDRTRSTVPSHSRPEIHLAEMLLTTLREELRSGVWPGGVLRTYKGISQKFGAPDVVVRAVVRVLRDEGLVTIHAFSGVRAAHRGALPTHGPFTVTDLIASTIRKRIGDHEYPPGTPLPQRTALAEEFDTTVQALQVPILQLTLEGLVRPHLPHEVPGTYTVDHRQADREARLLADLEAAMRLGCWTRGEFPDAVERALHVLIGSLSPQPLAPPPPR
ncbi:hypothetical protein ACGFRB_28945 [Streptomyces sp. NPDC048718]|uniref:hypothetical protein n=1 Tax=Streptomyces sp. NPDC048718 TaxID=3365587 RepID=UPI0037100D86